MLETYKRPLTAAELRLLRREASFLERRLRANRRWRWLGPAILLLTLPATILVWQWKAANYALLTLFAGIGWGVAILWGQFSAMRDLERRLGEVRAPEENGQAEVLRCQSKAVVGWEEQEDEGPAWFFVVDEERILVITGQEFGETHRFPNSDFEFVIARGRSQMVLYNLRCQGRKLKPLRMLPAELKSELPLPENLEVLHGRLSAIEAVLRARKPAALS